ncbi:hypothetical protein [Pedococcus sp. 5OH_020]|jgi:hypothetical protein|nr:hypothetical protein [Pedococcus sp. 5OH_020]
MKAITTIFESILRDNKDLVWAPEDSRDGAATQFASNTWSWGG